MNEWVAPHRLICVSAFEEDHPNHSRGIFHIVVLSKKPEGEAVTNRQQLKDPEALIGDLYKFHLKEAEKR